MENYSQRKTRLSKVFLFFSIAASILFFILGEIIYKELVIRINPVIFMGVYFGVFGLLLFLFLCMASVSEKLKLEKSGIIISIVCVILLCLLGMLFEFLYELGGKKEIKAADNYIFVIDNSGSMDVNDPQQERVAAVQQILSDKPDDFKYAVYSFGEFVDCIRSMGPAAEQEENIAVQPAGGTPVAEVLKRIVGDMEAGILEYDSYTQVILLTDGYATDAGFFDWNIRESLKFYAKNNICINTVGLGTVDERLLKKISDTTEGLNLNISDVGELADAMQSVIRTEKAERNLLSVRENVVPAWLYVVMRIGFITILGCIFAGIKLCVVNNLESQTIIIIFTAAGSLLAGVLLEVGLNTVGLPGGILRFTAAILIGLTPAYVKKTIAKGGYGDTMDWDSGNFDDYSGYTGTGGMKI